MGIEGEGPRRRLTDSRFRGLPTYTGHPILHTTISLSHTYCLATRMVSSQTVSYRLGWASSIPDDATTGGGRSPWGHVSCHGGADYLYKYYGARMVDLAPPQTGIPAPIQHSVMGLDSRRVQGET